jgi:predicted DNA-binding transcriptional regulator AlpA
MMPATNPSASDSPSEERLRAILREELSSALGSIAASPEAHYAARHGLLTARETAALLRVDQRTLRRLVHEGSVPPPVRIGRRAIRWDSRVLYRWLGMDEGVR